MRSDEGVNERINEDVLRWFGQVERLGNGSIAKRVYVGDCAGSRSVVRLLKRWTDTMKDCYKKNVNVRQARKRVYDKSE